MATDDGTTVEVELPTGNPAPTMGVPLGTGTGATTPPPPASVTSGQNGFFIVGSLQSGLQSAEVIFQAYSRLFEGFSQGIMDLGYQSLQGLASKAILATGDALFSPMRSLLEGSEDLGAQTMEVASIVEGMTGMTAAAIDMAGYDADNAALRMTKNTYEAVKGLTEAEITLANGVKLSTANFGDASDFLSSYSESALRDSRLYRAATEATTQEMLVSTQLARRNLGLSYEEINQIMQHELSNTGKISGDFLKEYERTAIATSRAAGVPMEMITRDLNTMLADFNHFGMMSLDQMGALSATVSKLGMNISDVTRLADNFQSFDKASQTMSNLAASTGATLDTLELFQLANTDQEQFIISLREQLESQGVEFENMNSIQQRNLAAAFGLDPLVMKRLLSDNFDEIESAQAAIAAEAAKIPPGAEEAFVASMKRLDQLSGEDFAKRYAGMKNVLFEYAAEIERGYLASTKITSEYVKASGDALDNYGSRIRTYRTMLDEFSRNVLGPPLPQPQQSTPGAAVTSQTVPAAPAAPVQPAVATPGAESTTTATGASPTVAIAQQPTTLGTAPVVEPVSPVTTGVTSTGTTGAVLAAPAAPTTPQTPGTAAATAPTTPIEIILRVEGTSELVNVTATAAGTQAVTNGVIVNGDQVTVKLSGGI